MPWCPRGIFQTYPSFLTTSVWVFQDLSPSSMGLCFGPRSNPWALQPTWLHLPWEDVCVALGLRRLARVLPSAFAFLGQSSHCSSFLDLRWTRSLDPIPCESLRHLPLGNEGSRPSPSHAAIPATSLRSRPLEGQRLHPSLTCKNSQGYLRRTFALLLVPGEGSVLPRPPPVMKAWSQQCS